ncbi:MAG: hypothetical protein Tsb0021_16570 [Chlamydiales bacterium]
MDSMSNETKKWSRYLLFFLLIYAVHLPQKLKAEDEFSLNFTTSNVLVDFEIYQENKMIREFENKFPTNKFNENFYTIEQFEAFLKETDKGIPTRNELIAKMQQHNIGYTKAIKNAEKTLQDAGIWNWYLEELFESAKNGIYVAVSGAKTLRAFVVAILDYSFKVITHGCTIYQTYYHYISEAEYHAEMFDFYHGMLAYYYGK